MGKARDFEDNFTSMKLGFGISFPDLYEREGLVRIDHDFEAAADRLALSLCAAGVLVIGIFPAPVWNLARQAAEALPFSTP